MRRQCRGEGEGGVSAEGREVVGLVQWGNVGRGRWSLCRGEERERVWVESRVRVYHIYCLKASAVNAIHPRAMWKLVYR